MSKRNTEGEPGCWGRGHLGILLAVVLLLGGCAQTRSRHDHWSDDYDAAHYGVERESIARSFNLHRGQWWNHYSRGRWYLESGHNAAAEADFRHAISLRETDKRDARTYGMHFVDYFASRELGIALFRQGQLAESLRRLEASFSDQPSARAAFYLNRVRTELLRDSRADQTKPVITLTQPAEETFINAPTIVIRGTVTDNHFVSRVNIGPQTLPLDLASPRIEVNERIALEPGENDVTIQAADLVGNTAESHLRIVRDVAPPNLFVGNTVRPRGPGGPIMLDLTVLDDFGLKEVRVGETSIDCDRAKEKALTRHEVPPGTTELSLVATDLAGNSRAIDLDLTSIGFLTSKPRTPAPTMLARDLGMFFLAQPASSSEVDGQGSEDTGPDIDLGLLSNNAIVSDENLLLNGRIKSGAPLVSITVNDGAVKLPKMKTRVAVFTVVVKELKLGPNRITVVAVDSQGRKAEISLTVNYVPRADLQPEARYSVGVSPFENHGPEKWGQDDAYDELLGALVDADADEKSPARFTAVVRDFETMQRLLIEHNIVQLADPSCAIELGKVIPAEVILVGQVRQGGNYVTLRARFVDTTNGAVLCVEEAYAESSDGSALRTCATTLVRKIERQFPLVEGVVDHATKKGTLYLNIGRNRGLRQGMKVLVYRSISTAVGTRKIPVPESGPQVEARIAEIASEWSSAKIITPGGAQQVQPGYVVITK